MISACGVYICDVCGLLLVWLCIVVWCGDVVYLGHWSFQRPHSTPNLYNVRTADRMQKKSLNGEGERSVTAKRQSFKLQSYGMTAVCQSHVNIVVCMNCLSTREYLAVQ